MYDQFRNELTHELTLRRIDYTTINTVLGALDCLMTNYTLTKPSKDLIPYECAVPEVLKFYLASKAVEGLSELTLAAKKRTIEDFFEKVRKAPEDVSAMDLRAYLYCYKESRQVTDRTLDKVREIICAFFKWLHCEEYLPSNPLLKVKIIKFERKHREGLSQLELEYLRKSCVTLKERCVLELLYSTGARISELRNMKKEDVDLQTGTVLLHGKGKRERQSYLNAKAMIAYLEYMQSRTDNSPYVIITDNKVEGNPDRYVTMSSGNRIIKRIVDRAKKTYTFNHPVSAHVIRHATAQTMLDRGASIYEVSHLLGHAHLDTTEHYVQVDKDAVRRAHAKTIV